MPRFARGVWWAGHGQLFLGAGLGVLGPALFAAGLLLPGSGSAAFAGLLLFAMAVPFACSGLLLRRFAPYLAKEESSLFFRVLELALVVLSIAVLSIAFVFVNVFVLLWIGYAWSIAAG